MTASDLRRIGGTLSSRQRQVLNGLKCGLSGKEIGSRLHISSHTVHCYVKGLYRHFNVCSRGELMALWVLQ